MAADELTRTETQSNKLSKSSLKRVLENNNENLQYSLDKDSIQSPCKRSKVDDYHQVETPIIRPTSTLEPIARLSESSLEIDELMNKTNKSKEDHDNGADNDGDFDDSLSELSGLLDNDSKSQSAIATMLWIEKRMGSGDNPRSILQHLLLDDTEIPEDLDDATLWKVIASIVAEPPKRKRLEKVCTFEDVISLIDRSTKIIVLTGAGVSVSCGIPDFRSRNGIYARLSIDYPDLPDPQAMFDITYFKKNPRPFFKFAKEIYPGQFKPSLSHLFIGALEQSGKLLRNYTQNIDTLEPAAGITRVIQCHGSFSTASCMVCKHKVDAETIREDVMNQVVPKCPKCPSDCDLSILKPDIVFFGESLSEEFHQQFEIDKEECDLLIVMGSSLKVRPVAIIPNVLPSHVPQVLINRESLTHMNFDVELLGDCDLVIKHLCKQLGDPFTNLQQQSTHPQVDEANEVTSVLDVNTNSTSNTSIVDPNTVTNTSDSANANNHQHHHHHCNGGNADNHSGNEVSMDIAGKIDGKLNEETNMIENGDSCSDHSDDVSQIVSISNDDDVGGAVKERALSSLSSSSLAVMSSPQTSCSAVQSSSQSPSSVPVFSSSSSLQPSSLSDMGNDDKHHHVVKAELSNTNANGSNSQAIKESISTDTNEAGEAAGSGNVERNAGGDGSRDDNKINEEDDDQPNNVKKLIDLDTILNGKEYVCLAARKYVFPGAEIYEKSKFTSPTWDDDDDDNEDESDGDDDDDEDNEEWNEKIARTCCIDEEHLGDCKMETRQDSRKIINECNMASLSSQSATLPCQSSSSTSSTSPILLPANDQLNSTSEAVDPMQPQHPSSSTITDGSTTSLTSSDPSSLQQHQLQLGDSILHCKDTDEN